MFPRIIIGVDGTEGGSDALALAHRLASPTTELIAVSVGVIDLVTAHAPDFDDETTVHRAALSRLADISEQYPEVRLEAFSAASVAAGLHDAAEGLDADLVVIGSSRRGILARVFVGDDAADTLRGSRWPVAVAPREYALRDAPISTIGLGWDGKSETGHALDAALTLAEDRGGRVHAVRVVGATIGAVATDGSESQPDAPAGVEVTVVTGTLVEELERFSAEVDLMVVGSHQRGPLGRITLGSASEQLIRRAPRPLLVVPRAAAVAAGPV